MKLKNTFLHLMLMLTFSVVLVDILLSSFRALALREAFPVLDVVALLHSFQSFKPRSTDHYALQASSRRKKIHSRLGKGVRIPHSASGQGMRIPQTCSFFHALLS